MESIAVPSENSLGLANLAEVKQVSVIDDNGTTVINELLSEGWKLLHIGHRESCTVYVLGRSVPSSRRATGFLA